MNIMQTTGIYFSPTGQSKQAVEFMLSAFSGKTASLDLTAYGKRPVYHFGENEAVIVAAPVYAGRIPETAKRRFGGLKGVRTPAILVVTYGNRAYGDALVELSDILKEQGFLPIAAAAVVARHSLVPEIAADRPTPEDIRKIRDFAEKCEESLREFSGGGQTGDLRVPGNHPTLPAEHAQLKIKVGNGCSGCGTCIRECPEQVISRTDPKIMDGERCISCMRCVALCPRGQRKVASSSYRVLKNRLKKACETPREPEFYLL